MSQQKYAKGILRFSRTVGYIACFGGTNFFYSFLAPKTNQEVANQLWDPGDSHETGFGPKKCRKIAKKTTFFDQNRSKNQKIKKS